MSSVDLPVPGVAVDLSVPGVTEFVLPVPGVAVDLSVPGVTGFVRIVELSLSSVSHPSLSLVVHSFLRTSEK